MGVLLVRQRWGSEGSGGVGYDAAMQSLSDAVILLFLVAVVFLSLFAGLAVGARTRLRGAPDQDHLGTIQGAILGLLALVLGFSFSAAMGRFTDRQDALSAEASAIGDAFDRAALLPAPHAHDVRGALGDYAALRLELFHEARAVPAASIEDRMLDRFESAQRAVYEGVRAQPSLTMLAIPAIEAVQNEFGRRSAFERRELPSELILVLILSSGMSMAVVGYGVGLAQRRSTGSAVALAALVAITLFLMIDFDRPRRGFIALDPAPLERAAQQTKSSPTVTP